MAEPLSQHAAKAMRERGFTDRDLDDRVMIALAVDEADEYEIAEQLGVPVEAIEAALDRLAQRGLIESVSRGGEQPDA